MPTPDHFTATAIGRDGGTSYRSGLTSAGADLRHGSTPVHITMEGRTVDGQPHVKIFAWGIGKEHVFYDGPLAAIAESPAPAPPFWRCGGCRKDIPGERDGHLCQACLDAAYSGKDGCMECDGKGWDVFNADPQHPLYPLGEIQRCDTCCSLADDDEAIRLARLAGLEVDPDGNILAVPYKVEEDGEAGWRYGLIEPGDSEPQAWSKHFGTREEADHYGRESTRFFGLAGEGV